MHRVLCLPFPELVGVLSVEATAGSVEFLEGFPSSEVVNEQSDGFDDDSVERERVDSVTVIVPEWLDK